MRKKLLLASMSMFVLALAAFQPKPAAASCLMDGSTCVSADECCSNRCMVLDPGEEYGECDPVPIKET